MSIDSSSQSGFVLNPWVVIVIGLVAAAGVGGWMWFSNPGRVTAPDGPVRIEAPSGTRSMELVETCPGDTQCERVAIYEFSQTGETIRLECELNLPGTTPLFVSVTPQWLADETILRIDYADAEGQAGSLLFDLVADCHPGVGTSG